MSTDADWVALNEMTLKTGSEPLRLFGATEGSVDTCITFERENSDSMPSFVFVLTERAIITGIFIHWNNIYNKVKVV